MFVISKTALGAHRNNKMWLMPNQWVRYNVWKLLSLFTILENCFNYFDQNSPSPSGKVVNYGLLSPSRDNLFHLCCTYTWAHATLFRLLAWSNWSRRFSTRVITSCFLKSVSKCAGAHMCCQEKPGKGREAMLLVLSVGWFAPTSQSE